MPNFSPPDTELYKALGRRAARGAPGRGGGARDPGGVHRQLGVPATAGCTATGSSPFILDDDEWRRIHGNDERISLENLTEGVRVSHRDAARRGGRVMARRALTIRRGTERDVPTILALIRGLAEYERLAHEMRGHAARVRATGSGAGATSRRSSAGAAARPVGFALYFFTYSTFLARPTLYLEDLFVLPEERGHRGGEGAAPRPGAHRGPARVRAPRVGGARLEPSRDRLLQAARREAAPAVDPHAAHRGPAPPPGALRATATVLRVAATWIAE